MPADPDYGSADPFRMSMLEYERCVILVLIDEYKMKTGDAEELVDKYRTSLVTQCVKVGSYASYCAEEIASYEEQEKEQRKREDN